VETPTKLVFRTPPTAVLGALLLAITATPFAFSAPGLYAVYVVPIGAIYWVLRVRTTADTDGLVARHLFAKQTLAWTDLKGFALSERSWVRAVRQDGTEVPLPTVRTRHVPALSLVSGGRLADPTEAPAEAEPAEPTTAHEQAT
jgi:PH (Pleckstrin Homology) domain-containing protein